MSQREIKFRMYAVAANAMCFSLMGVAAFLVGGFMVPLFGFTGLIVGANIYQIVTRDV